MDPVYSTFLEKGILFFCMALAVGYFVIENRTLKAQNNSLRDKYEGLLGQVSTLVESAKNQMTAVTAAIDKFIDLRAKIEAILDKNK